MSLPSHDIYIGTTGPHATSGWTQLNASGVGAGSVFTRAVEWTPNGVAFPADAMPAGVRSGSILSTDVVNSDARSGELRIRSTYTGSDKGTDLKAEMLDEWATIVSDVVSPADGEIYLRFDRADRSASTLSYVLICRISEAPDYKPVTNRHDVTAIDLRYQVEALYPYYVRRVGETQAYLNATTSAVSQSITNGGHTDAVGISVEVDAVDSGTPTVLTLENTTTSKSLVMTFTTIITAGDIVDYHASDPRVYDVSQTTNAVHLDGSTVDLVGFLDRGANTVEASVDAGQVDVTLTWYDERYIV